MAKGNKKSSKRITKTPSQLKMAQAQRLIGSECDAVKDLLIEKNKAYGNSFAEPIGIFAKGLEPKSQIRVRIDDKLTRLKKGSEYPGDDTVLDLIGYLVLYRVAQRMEEEDGK